ncbi:MAG TPA: CPBP family intramembrane metalloprotease [Flavobacteriales bacterium]|nr:CPBP family intramembrane metalloprotease [Flavobacteriales bacterium]
MEQSSVPERPLPDPARPPQLEFAMGIALFAIILMAFMLAQFAVLVTGVAAIDPAYAGKGFSLSLLQDDAFQASLERYLLNGDLVAREALWSGLIGLGLILLTVFLWKRSKAGDFLGLGLPNVRRFLVWFGIFLLLAAALEVLMRSVPAFQTDFMEKVLGSTTNRTLLVIGVGIMAPLFEEFLLRGLLFGTVRHIVDEHASVAITAGVFTIMHLQYEVLVMMLILPLGVVLGYARARTGSIWVPILLHVLNNLASVLLN